MDTNDNGFVSRKLWFSAGTSLLIVLGIVLVGIWPAAAVVYPEAVMGLLGVLTVFVGGNLGAKFILGKVGKTLANPDPEDPSQEEPQSDPENPEPPSAS